MGKAAVFSNLPLCDMFSTPNKISLRPWSIKKYVFFPCVSSVIAFFINGQWTEIVSNTDSDMCVCLCFYSSTLIGYDP